VHFGPERPPQINLSEFVFLAAHYKWSLPPTEEFPNTDPHRFAQWLHLATSPVQPISLTYFVIIGICSGMLPLALPFERLAEKLGRPWIA